MTLCSPDPQAIRPPEEKVNVLQVTLPTNFKVARFDSDKHTAILRQLQDDIEAIRFDTRRRQDRTAGEAQGARFHLRAARQVGDAADRQLPLRHQGRHAITIKEAVHTDIEASRSVYNFVRDLCVKLGAAPDDLVPFEKYAAAARGLTRPSSAARALNNGAPNIERADKLVQAIAAQKGLRHPVIDATVALVDARLEANRKKAAA